MEGRYLVLQWSGKRVSTAQQWGGQRGTAQAGSGVVEGVGLSWACGATGGGVPRGMWPGSPQLTLVQPVGLQPPTA